MKKIDYMGWAVAALLAVSCQGSVPGGSTDVTPGIVDTPTVKWDAGVNTSPVVSEEGGSFSVTFTSSDAWTASIVNGRADWLRLSPGSGSKGKGTLTIQVNPNEEYEERRATVQVKCGTAQVTLTVTQKQKDAFTATASKQEFGAEGGDFTIQVNTTVDFTCSVTAGEEWLVPVQTKGLTPYSLVYKVLANENTEKREGAVLVSSSLGQETFKVFQQGAEATLVLSSNQVAVSEEGGVFTVEVRHNVAVSMEIPKGVDWISEVITRSMSTDSYTFAVSANVFPEFREADIRFFNEELGLSETVKVTQNGKKTDYGQEPGFFGLAGLMWAYVPQQMQLHMVRDTQGNTGVFTLLEPSSSRFIQLQYAPVASLAVGSTVSVYLIQNVNDSLPTVQENLSFQVKSIDGPFVTLVDEEGHEAILKQ